MKFLRSFCIPQTVMILVVVILGISSMLSGCGQKGPLHMPEGMHKDMHKQQQK